MAKPKLGSGKRFAELVDKLKGRAKNPKALAAYIGRKKYGNAKMSKWSVAGRERHER